MSDCATAGANCLMLVLAASIATAQDPNGIEFRVNAYTTGNQHAPQVAVDGSGHYVVVWEGAGTDDPSGVFARRYLSSGEPLGSEFAAACSASVTAT